MTTILDNIIQLLSNIIFICFGLAFIGWVLLMLGKETGEKKFKILGVILFGQLFLVGFTIIVVRQIATHRARTEVLNFLSKEYLVVKLEGIEMDSISSDSIIRDLMRIQRVSAHHSGPTQNRKIVIMSKAGSIDLEVAADSQNPNEFWVFYTKYSFIDEVGHFYK